MLKERFNLFDVFKYLSLIFASMIAIVPILVVFFSSFKTHKEYGSTSPISPPSNWLNFGNYRSAFIDGGMLKGFFNTFIILGAVLIGSIILGTMVAYVMNRFIFRGSKLILGAFLLAALIPSVTTQVATFKVVSFLKVFNINLFNSLGAPIVLGLGTDIIAIYIFIQFIATIPVSLDESAMLDGASYFTIYWRIILPLLKPAIAVVVILKGVAVYNDFYTPFLYMPKAGMQTVSTSLFRFMGPFGGNWEIICAGVMIAIVPTLIAFLLLQKYFYNGFTGGSVKL